MRVALRTDLENAWQFHLPAEMSPTLRNFYQQAVRRFSARAVDPAKERPVVVPKLSTRVIVNGQEFASTGPMPPAYRHFYEQILAQALPIDRAIYTVARTEHANFIFRTVALSVIALGVAGAIVYLWLHGYYA